MNNLENLLANNQDALIKILGYADNADCFKDCPAQRFCAGAGIEIDGCAVTRATWLLQEYVKPDSWDQIEADAAYLVGKFTCRDMREYEVPKALEEVMNLIYRCKALAGVEGASNGF